MQRRIRFASGQSVGLETFELQPPGPGQVGIKTLYSLVSTGTESTILRAQHDPREACDDDQISWPYYPGRAVVGLVSTVGPDVLEPAPGALVAIDLPHASAHVTEASRCFPVPGGVDPREATWFALGKSAAMGARAADHGPGDTALVIGAGPVGQMALRWAFACGVTRLMVCDPAGLRLDMARKGGATHLFPDPIELCLDQVKAANGGEFPNVVIDATGHAAVFGSALAAVAPYGRVVLLGDTGLPPGQHLSSDVITKGLTIVGAHDKHDRPGWDSAAIQEIFFALARSGRFPLNGLISHTFKPDDYQAMYDLLEQNRGATMGVLFDWTGE